MTVAEEWIEQGKQEGRQEGRQEGEVSTLLRQIERKFGLEARKAYQTRVENASLEELELWLDRFATADCVEEIFGAQ